MSLQVEKLEKNMAKLTIEASAEDFEKAIQKARSCGMTEAELRELFELILED